MKISTKPTPRFGCIFYYLCLILSFPFWLDSWSLGLSYWQWRFWFRCFYRKPVCFGTWHVFTLWHVWKKNILFVNGLLNIEKFISKIKAGKISGKTDLDLKYFKVKINIALIHSFDFLVDHGFWITQTQKLWAIFY